MKVAHGESWGKVLYDAAGDISSSDEDGEDGEDGEASGDGGEEGGEEEKK